MAKLLYRWDDKKFEEEYMKKLEKNWYRWKNDRKIDESEYLRKLKESLEWNEMDEKRSKIIWGDNTAPLE